MRLSRPREPSWINRFRQKKYFIKLKTQQTFPKI